MMVEIVSGSISTKVWDWFRIELMTPASTLSTGLLCPVDCPLYLYHVSSQQTALCGYYSCKNKINIKSLTGVSCFNLADCFQLVELQISVAGFISAGRIAIGVSCFSSADRTL